MHPTKQYPMPPPLLLPSLSAQVLLATLYLTLFAAPLTPPHHDHHHSTSPDTLHTSLRPNVRQHQPLIHTSDLSAHSSSPNHPATTSTWLSVRPMNIHQDRPVISPRIHVHAQYPQFSSPSVRDAPNARGHSTPGDGLYVAAHGGFSVDVSTRARDGKADVAKADSTSSDSNASKSHPVADGDPKTPNAGDEPAAQPKSDGGGTGAPSTEGNTAATDSSGGGGEADAPTGGAGEEGGGEGAGAGSGAADGGKSGGEGESDGGSEETKGGEKGGGEGKTDGSKDGAETEGSGSTDGGRESDGSGNGAGDGTDGGGGGTDGGKGTSEDGSGTGGNSSGDEPKQQAKPSPKGQPEQKPPEAGTNDTDGSGGVQKGGDEEGKRSPSSMGEGDSPLPMLLLYGIVGAVLVVVAASYVMYRFGVCGSIRSTLFGQPYEPVHTGETGRMQTAGGGNVADDVDGWNDGWGNDDDWDQGDDDRPKA